MDQPDLNDISKLVYSGHPEKAIMILAMILRVNPRDELAWLLLADCVAEDYKKLDCYKQVLKINPSNDRARGNIKLIEQFYGINAATTKSLEKQEASALAKIIEPTRDLNPTLKARTPTPPSQKKEKTVKNKLKATKSKEHKPTVDTIATKSPQARSTKKPLVSSGDQKAKNKKKSKSDISSEPILRTIKLEKHRESIKKDQIDPLSRMFTGVYGKHITVDGVSISNSDSPPCIQTGSGFDEADCDFCEFFTPDNCLLRLDEYLLDDINRFNELKAERQLRFVKRSKTVSRIIHNELKAHGRPLHFSVISKMVNDRYPKLHLTENGVYRFMTWHPSLFESIGNGVYRAK